MNPPKKKPLSLVAPAKGDWVVWGVWGASLNSKIIDLEEILKIQNRG